MSNSVGDRINIALGRRPAAWLAREAGISASTLAAYRRGSVPAADVALRIADKLDVSLRWLITGEGNIASAVPSADSGISTSDAADLLERIETALRESTKIEEVDLGQLIAVANDDRLSDKIRARADLAIRFACNDSAEVDAAESRQRDRGRRHQAEMERAKAIINDAIEASRWSPPAEIRSHLVNFVRIYKVDGDAITVLLYDLARLLPAGD